MALSAFSRRFSGYARIDQRQLHVVQRSGARQQVEGLKNKADFLVADARQLVVGHLADQVAVDVVLPARRRIQATDQVHQGRFARPEGPMMATYSPRLISISTPETAWISWSPMT